MLYELGDANWRLGNLDAARNYLEESLALARGLGDNVRMAFALNRLGLLRFGSDLDAMRAVKMMPATHSAKNGYYGEGNGLSTSTPGVYAEKEEIERLGIRDWRLGIGDSDMQSPKKYTEGVHIHLYGKKITKPFRKMGHVTRMTR